MHTQPEHLKYLLAEEVKSQRTDARHRLDWWAGFQQTQTGLDIYLLGY